MDGRQVKSTPYDDDFHNTTQPARHRFALQLGDVIDGGNKRNGHSEAALSSVKAEVDRLAATLPLGVLNSLGNHELYNFPKKRWAKEVIFPLVSTTY